MKNLLFLIVFIGSTVSLFAQNYSDGVNDLLEMKFASRDIANAIKWEWDNESPEYKGAIKRYNEIANSVDAMIGAFEAKIRSGQKVSDSDISTYVNRIDSKFQAFFAYYDENSVQGGANALFGIDKIFTAAGELFGFVFNAVNTVQNAQIEKRVVRMHNALDQCRLTPWAQI